MDLKDLLLTRSGLVALPQPTRPDPLEDRWVQAVEVNLAGLGFALSHDLSRALAHLDVDQLARVQRWLHDTLAAHLGAGVPHEPLFRTFPEGIPKDTLDLWFRKVLAHFLQEQDQPCLFCGAVGTTFVLDPCLHVVCGRCWDGRTYSACPVCEHHVDPSSPFFQPTLADRWSEPEEKVVFKRLHVTWDAEGEAARLFQSLCARTQALSPTDCDALTLLVQHWGEGVLARVPPVIPVRENVARVFGLLLARGLAPAPVLEAARPHLKSATDLLRVIAVMSGADPSLQPQPVLTQVRPTEQMDGRWHGRLASMAWEWTRKNKKPCGLRIHSSRFKVAPMGRPLRRALLGLLEGFKPDLLLEDMLRHRAEWVWVGRFLHPFEQARRYPNVTRAFLALRGTLPAEGDPLWSTWVQMDASPDFRMDGRGHLHYLTFNARTEALLRRRDGLALARHLSARPGELARKADLVLRLAQDPGPVLDLLLPRVGAMATPVLLLLSTSMPLRGAPWPARVFFPRGRFFLAPSAPDRRPLLDPQAVLPLARAAEQELLQRFRRGGAVEMALLDRALQRVPAPFNERTASRGALSVPRGASLDLPDHRIARLFLHWCQPSGGEATDIDLSVGFFDADWNHEGTCAYYQLAFEPQGRPVARSSGDLRDGPWPDGASEFVDIQLDQARRAGLRYAVMVVTNYAGMPFSAMERGFAGLMLRDDPRRATFDPRTVALRFAIDGENGVFTPLVLDLQERSLFWLDACTRGLPSFNNVENRKNTLRRMCGDSMALFGHGVRPSMFRLGALHGASRARVTWVRETGGFTGFERRAGESPLDLYHRILAGDADHRAPALPPPTSPTLALLLKGDLELPEGSAVWALLPEQVRVSLAASDLLSAPGGP